MNCSFATPNPYCILYYENMYKPMHEIITVKCLPIFCFRHEPFTQLEEEYDATNIEELEEIVPQESGD